MRLARAVFRTSLHVVTTLVLALAATAAFAQAPPPAPPKPERLADGRLNWTGFWTPRGGLFDKKLGPGFVAVRPAPATPAATASPDPNDPAALLKSPYKERFAEIRRKEARGIPAYDPTAVCFPPGMPRMMNMTYGMEILQAPGVIAITSEWGPATRRIWLDGRAHPPEDELDATYVGDSVGHWEGDVLVVDTVGLRIEAVLTQGGLMHSEKMHLAERFSMPEPGVLVDEITVTDPDVFERPWKIVRRYGYRPDLSLREYVCQDNNRNISADGKPKF